VLKRHWVIAISFIGLVGIPSLRAAAPASEENPFKWKLEKDKTFYQEVSSETTQNLKILASDVKNVHKQTFYFSWKVKDKDQKDGNWTLEQKIEGLKMEFNIGGQTVSYDSTKQTGSSSQGLGEFFKALVGTTFTVMLDKDFKVTEVKGRQEFIQKLASVNPQMDQLLRQILSEEALKNMAAATFAVGPNKEVKQGGTWDRKTKLDLGPIGLYDITYGYTYEGKDKSNSKLERIKIDPKITYTPPKDTVALSGLPFKIKSADLKMEKGEGNILFDPEKGRIDSSTITLQIKGPITIDIAGQVSVVTLDQTQTTTLKNTDSNPIGTSK